MKKTTKKHIKTAEESLEDILKRIGPYLPKSPEPKEKPEVKWKLASKGELLPLNSQI